MKSIVLKELRLQRKVLIIWSIIIFLTAAFGGIEFNGLQNQMELLETTVADFPRIVKILFGVDAFPISTNIGSYASMFYWYQLVLFAFAVYIGFYLVGKDEKQNYADFIYTKPFSRETVLLAKSIVVLIINSILAFITALGSFLFLVPFLPNGEDLLPYILVSTLGMLLTQLIFSSLGMMFGAIIKNYKKGMLVSFIALITSYIISYTIEYSGNLNHLNFLSPVRYFNLSDIATKGLSPIYISLSVAIIVVLIIIAVKGFGKKDLV